MMMIAIIRVIMYGAATRHVIIIIPIISSALAVLPVQDTLTAHVRLYRSSLDTVNVYDQEIRISSPRRHSLRYLVVCLCVCSALLQTLHLHKLCKQVPVGTPKSENLNGICALACRVPTGLQVQVRACMCESAWMQQGIDCMGSICMTALGHDLLLHHDDDTAISYITTCCSTIHAPRPRAPTSQHTPIQTSCCACLSDTHQEHQDLLTAACLLPFSSGLH